MKSTHGFTLLLMGAALLCSPGPARAQDSLEAPKVTVPAPGETRADVPALDDFHAGIMKLWHDAWPSKDYATLRALLPEIRQRADAVAKAELPGILRDKEVAWGEGVKELEARVADYAAAAGGIDDQKLLDAAERLHAQTAKLARTIRPAIPELDAFHVVLYKLYHYDLPGNDLVVIRATVGQPKEPMSALNAASLPKGMESRQKEFVAARKQLSNAVNKLVSTAKSSDKDRVQKAILDMHSRYLELSAVFD